MQPFLLVHFDKSISFCLLAPLLLLGGICFEHASAHLRISAAAINSVNKKIILNVYCT